MKYLIAISFFIFATTSACTEDNTPQSHSMPTPQRVSLPVRNIEDELIKYSHKLVTSTDNNISNPKIIKTTDNAYVIEFQTSDPALMPDQNADKDVTPEAYARNVFITTAWGAKFCTPELKSIIADHELQVVSGQIKMSSTSMCWR